MRLRKRPARPEWKPFYAAHGARVASWDRFMAHEPALVTGLTRKGRPPRRRQPRRGVEQGCAPGRAADLQSPCTGFESLRPCCLVSRYEVYNKTCGQCVQ